MQPQSRSECSEESSRDAIPLCSFPKNPVHKCMYAHNYKVPFTPPCQLHLATRVFAHLQAQSELAPLCQIQTFSGALSLGKPGMMVTGIRLTDVAVWMGQLNLVGGNINARKNCSSDCTQSPALLCKGQMQSNKKNISIPFKR